MIPTPDLSHFRPDDYEHIYEPAEDTFLLLDALEQDASELRTLAPVTCLEIGSGSGCVSSFLGAILPPSSSLFLCTDINPRACIGTYKTGVKNKVPLNPFQTAFALPFDQRLAHAVDLIVFNPPYVPTIAEEADVAQKEMGIQGAWAGGDDGMDVTNQFLDMVPNLLSPNGIFYLVALKSNNIADIQARMLLRELKSHIVLNRRAGREHLFILKFSRR